MQTGALAGANLLLITVDTLRADVLGAYGGDPDLTPTIDRLARDGVRFDAAWAHAPMTLPSHASILTGLYPFAHGVRANGSFRLDDGPPTLAELLGAAGYRTGAFVGAFVLDVRFGLGRGFDHYDDLYGEQGAGSDFRFVERRADAVLEPAAAWIEGQDGPWLAWVHLFDPHAPYDAPEPFMRGRRARPYTGEVAYVDHTLGGFLDRLDAADRLSDTLIVLTADHGESLGEHGEQTHGAFAYDATLRVPLVLHAAGRLPAAEVRDAVGHVDVLPTVLDLLGVPVPDSVQGAALLTRPRATSRALYFEALDGHFAHGLAPLSGVIEGRHKFIELPARELYDLATDPHEVDNLAAARPEAVAGYRGTLERLLEVSGTPIDSSPVLTGLFAAPAGGIDADTRSRLAALGYVVDAGAPGTRAFTAADDPKNALSVIEKHRDATAMFADGRHLEAIALLDELVRARPAAIAAQVQLASMLETTGRLPQALAVLEAAHARAPGNGAVAAKLGVMLALSGDAARGIELLQGALTARPEDVELLEGLAIARAAGGQGTEARRLLERALEIDPSSASAHHNLGLTWAQQGDFDAAIACFEQAIALAPGFWYPYEGLGGALAAKGRMEEAVVAWARQVELHPDSVDTTYNLGVVLADLGRRAEALPYLDRFVALAPADDPAVPPARRLAADIRAALRR